MLADVTRRRLMYCDFYTLYHRQQVIRVDLFFLLVLYNLRLIPPLGEMPSFRIFRSVRYHAFHRCCKR